MSGGSGLYIFLNINIINHIKTIREGWGGVESNHSACVRYNIILYTIYYLLAAIELRSPYTYDWTNNMIVA